MSQEAVFVGDAQFSAQTEFDADIDALAQETCAPRVQVASLYFRELAKLQGGAKIKTYVPVLARRRVKGLLREQRRT